MVDLLEEEVMTYISKFYDKHKIRPNEVIVPDIVDTDVLSKAFDLKVVVPSRGKKKKMLDLAIENATNYLNEQISLVERDEAKTIGAMEELGKLLHIEGLSRIELFDNSNLFGNFNVSGMVVFIDGKPAKNYYRKFKITKDVNDVYGPWRR